MPPINSRAMVTHYTTNIVNRQLSNSAQNTMYDPTARERVSNHETDKQFEDNMTWLFEYMALLNSRLTTLTTALTSAYTTDLDAAMGKKTTSDNGPVTWGNKSAMQGITGLKDTGNNNAIIVDPGAARTTMAYLTTYGDDPAVNVAANLWAGTGATAGGQANFGQSLAISSGSFTDGANTYGSAAGNEVIAGTTSFVSGSNEAGTMVLDLMYVNLDVTGNPSTVQAAGIDTSPGSNHGNHFIRDKNFNRFQDVSLGGAGDVMYNSYRQVGSNLEKKLFEFFTKRQNLDIIRFGLFNDIYVVGTSSLPSGSQIQGSIKLNFEVKSNANGGNGAGFITITQERFSAFFHS